MGEIISSEKVKKNHLQRKAIIYIRQSSEIQVQNNIESRHLQYALRDKVKGLGWNEVIIIDEDLGKSASYFSERTGFQKIVTQVSMGEVGIVVSLEASRLSRNNRDWYHLIDLCSVFDTLLGDDQAIYDPTDPNDRLVLGVKGTISEAELNIIKVRMRQGRYSKAKRGKLYTTVPTGYIITEDERVEITPDKSEQETIELIFNKFRELRSIMQTHLWFIDEKITVPVNYKGITMQNRTIKWRLPSFSFIRNILRNPFYAGAYVYGRTGTKTYYENGQIKKTKNNLKSMKDWDILIKDHHEGYISWKEYEENLEVMRNNKISRGEEGLGAVRKGKGLLVGMMRCQRCGRKMCIRYSGKGKSAMYFCPGEFGQRGACQSFTALKTDKMFEEELFRAIEPASIQASLKACEAVNERYQEEIKYLERELEKAEYEANRAYTQYNR